MYFELQLSAAVLARVIRNRLRSLPLGLDLGVPDPDGDLVVDRVVIGDTTTLQRERSVAGVVGVPMPAATQMVTTLSPTNLDRFTVPYLQVRQEVKVLLVRAADLEANGPAATPPALTVTIYPVFNVSLKAANQTQGGGPLTLTYALAYVEFGAVALELDEGQRAADRPGRRRTDDRFGGRRPRCHEQIDGPPGHGDQRRHRLRSHGHAGRVARRLRHRILADRQSTTASSRQARPTCWSARTGRCCWTPR